MANTLPSIFSVQRGFIISDGLMFNLFEDGSTSPINVIRHGILGTQNTLHPKDGVKNPQRTESAKTSPDAVGMNVSFSMSTILLKDVIFACNDNEFRNKVDDFIQRFRGSRELREVCMRYARNILNARWLWRNRLLGQSIAVKVEMTDAEEDKTIEVDASKIPQQFFRDYTEEERRLGEYLLGGLIHSPCHLKVTATIKFGMKGAIEVYPSQNYVGNKPEGFARSLYKLNRIERKDLLRIVNDSNALTFFGDLIDMGHAALRDQKIGNAIRTIDTWYVEGRESAPIPVEPKGANIESNEYKRPKHNLFNLITQVSDIQSATDGQPLNADAMFVLANLLRGFLAGEKKENNSSQGQDNGDGGQPKPKGKQSKPAEQGSLLEGVEAE